MARMRELETTGSWFVRAHAQGAVTPGPSIASAPIARALQVSASEGWDPYEVWLRRIDEPRRVAARRAQPRE
jgi:hypothetical protein